MSYRENMLVLAFEQFEALKGPTTDPRWGTALKILAAGDLDGAAKLVGELVSNVKYIPLDPVYRPEEFAASFNHAIYEMVISTLSNLATLKPKLSPAIVEMLCKAADSGFPDSAYNAANGLSKSAKTQEGFKLAEHYYKLAIERVTDKSMRAAAIVNYAELIREGHTTGKKDYIAAISLYEQAAKEGMITAMYNVGNVCMWEVSLGNTDLLDRADYWFKEVVKTVDSGAPWLALECHDFVPEALRESVKQLADIHINKKVKVADPEFGIQMARRITIENDNDQLVKNWLLEVGLSNRIASLSAPQTQSAADNWHYLLKNLDWDVGPITRGAPAPFDTFEIKHSKGSVVMVVLALLFEPHKRYSPLDSAVSQIIRETGAEHVFVVSAIAMFVEADKAIHVPVMVYTKTTWAVATLNQRMSPEEIINNTETGQFFMDPRGRIINCSLPIAINMLNSGRKISDGLNWEAKCAVVNNVCIPDFEDYERINFMKPD